MDSPQSRNAVEAAIDNHPQATPVGVAAIDIDGFAVLNEALGRQAGDRVLENLQRIFEQNLPQDTELYRVGGDEWVIVFPSRPVETCLVLMEEIRAHVATHPLHESDAVAACTISAGVAARPPHGETGSALLRCADVALSRAKRDGRNKVGIFIEEKMVLKSNYYSRATLDRLSAVSKATQRTEASLLREAADQLLDRYSDLI